MAADFGVVDGFVKSSAGNVSLHCRRYEKKGKSDEKPTLGVLFHHGWTSDKMSFDAAAHFLASTGRYLCVTFDARGTGDSERPKKDEDFSMDCYVADAISVADAHFGPDNRFVLFGHSMGGLISYQIALQHKDRLAQLVLVAPSPSHGLVFPPEFFQPAFERWQAAKAGSQDEVRKMLAYALLTHPKQSHETDDERTQAHEYWIRKGLHASEEHYRGSWQMMRSFNRHADLPSITTPTLMVLGSADSLLVPNLKDYRAMRKIATLHVFSNCGHSPQREREAEFNRVILQFLDQGPSNWPSILQKVKQASRLAKL